MQSSGASRREIADAWPLAVWQLNRKTNNRSVMTPCRARMCSSGLTAVPPRHTGMVRRTRPQMRNGTSGNLGIPGSRWRAPRN